MKKRYVKVLSLVMTVVALFLCLPSCSSEKTKPVLEIDGVTIGADVYRYWLSTFKYYFDTQYNDIEDTVECWNKEMEDGTTIGEYVEQYTLQYAKSVVCSLKLFKQYKLKLSDSALETIDGTIDDLVKYQYGDSKSAFNNALMSTYGIDMKGLRRAFIMEAKVDAVESYLFGTNGKEAPTAQELDAFYKENYIRVSLVMINTSYELVFDDKGVPLYDSKGEPVTKKYTEEEIAAKKAKADEVEQKAKGDADFAELVKTYNELKFEDRPNGFYLSSLDYEALVKRGYDSETLTRVLNLKEGEVFRYDDKESIVILKRLPLIDNAYASKEDAPQFEDMKGYLITQKYNKILSDMWEDIEIDDYVYTLKTVDVKKGFI